MLNKVGEKKVKVVTCYNKIVYRNQFSPTFVIVNFYLNKECYNEFNCVFQIDAVSHPLLLIVVFYDLMFSCLMHRISTSSVSISSVTVLLFPHIGFGLGC